MMAVDSQRPYGRWSGKGLDFNHKTAKNVKRLKSPDISRLPLSSCGSLLECGAEILKCCLV